MDILQNKTIEERQELLNSLQAQSDALQQKTITAAGNKSELKKAQAELEQCKNAIALVREYSFTMDTPQAILEKPQSKSFKSSLKKSRRKSAEEYLKKQSQLEENSFTADAMQETSHQVETAKQNYDNEYNNFVKENNLAEGDNALPQVTYQLHFMQKSIQGDAYDPYKKSIEEKMGTGAYSRLIAPMLHYFEADASGNPITMEAQKIHWENLQILKDITGETDTKQAPKYLESNGARLLKEIQSMPTPDASMISENEKVWPNYYAKYNSIILTFSNYADEIKRLKDHPNPNDPVAPMVKPFQKLMDENPEEWKKLSAKIDVYTKINTAFSYRCSAIGASIDTANKNWYQPLPKEAAEVYTPIIEETLHKEGGAEQMLLDYKLNFDRENYVKEQYEEHKKTVISTNVFSFFEKYGGTKGLRLDESDQQRLPKVFTAISYGSRRMAETVGPLTISENLEQNVSEEQIKKVTTLYKEAFVMKEENDAEKNITAPERVVKQKELFNLFYDHVGKQVDAIEKKLNVVIEDGKIKQINDVDEAFIAKNFNWCANFGAVGANITTMDNALKELIEKYPETYGDLKELKAKGDYISARFLRYSFPLTQAARSFHLNDTLTKPDNTNKLQDEFIEASNEMNNISMKEAYDNLQKSLQA